MGPTVARRPKCGTVWAWGTSNGHEESSRPAGTGDRRTRPSVHAAVTTDSNRHRVPTRHCRPSPRAARSAGTCIRTGADEVVISYAELGGFMPQEFAFRQTPNVLISGDGQVFSPGAQIEIYPGPLLPAVQVQTHHRAGHSERAGGGRRGGLLADVDYTVDSNVADASTATVTISRRRRDVDARGVRAGFHRSRRRGIDARTSGAARLRHAAERPGDARRAGESRRGNAVRADRLRDPGSPRRRPVGLRNGRHRADRRGVAERRVGSSRRCRRVHGRPGSRGR